MKNGKIAIDYKNSPLKQFGSIYGDLITYYNIMNKFCGDFVDVCNVQKNELKHSKT